MSVKGFFKGIGQFFRYLFFTPAGGNEARAGGEVALVGAYLDLVRK